MRRLSLGAAVLSLAACGGEPEPCTIEDTPSGVTIKCPDGTTATVDDGEDGASGTNGQPGNNNHIVATHFCQGALPDTSLIVSYSAALTAAGDVFVRASVRNGAIENDASQLYAAGQAGAATANVVFQFDVAGAANNGWWQIGLNRTTMVQLVVYNDLDVTNGQDAWTKNPGECISNVFP